MVNKTALYWITSDAEEAKSWRKQADGETFLRMVNRAVSEKPGKHFDIPPEAIEQPTTRTSKFFTLPPDVDSTPERGTVEMHILNDWLTEEEA